MAGVAPRSPPAREKLRSGCAADALGCSRSSMGSVEARNPTVFSAVEAARRSTKLKTEGSDKLRQLRYVPNARDAATLGTPGAAATHARCLRSQRLLHNS